MKKDIPYFRNKILALRNACDDLLVEMEGAGTPSSPRKRRNLKEGRVIELAADYAGGKWRKPKELRKSK